MGMLVMNYASQLPAQEKSPAILLQEALYQEETEGNLDKAMELYGQVLQQAADVERLAARAAYQLGLCHLKKDNPTEAATWFRRVVSDYPKQAAMVKKAQAELEKITPQEGGNGLYKLQQPINVNISTSPDGDRLTVQYAAMEIAKAAGIPYQWQKSQDLAGSKARRYIDSFTAENKKAAEALSELLLPIGLTYGVDENGLFLSTPENLRANQTTDLSTKNLMELALDDGKQAGKWSMAGSGHAVRFTAPADKCVLRAVRIYGSRYGEHEPPKENFSVYLCDKDFEVLKEFEFPYSMFKQRGVTKWVNLRTEPTEVPSEFILCVGFDPHRSKGIYLYHDEQSSGTSFTGLPGNDPAPFDEGDWLLRALLQCGNPAGDSKPGKLKAEDLVAEGWQLWQQRKLAEAEAKFEEAITADPQNEGVYQGLGWAQLNQGKKQNAEASFKKCVKLNPKNAAALNGLGWIAYGQDDKQTAIKWWKKAVEAQPGATAALSGLTKAMTELGQYKEAVKYYQMWLKVEPNSQDAKDGLEKAKQAMP
jgi:RNA polymerase sigma-70 factor (ECF subfamily)